MIGQTSLRSHIEKIIQEDAFPRFTLIAGSKGSGKKTFAEWIATTLGYRTSIVTDLKIDSIRDVIASCMTLREPHLFIFPNAHEMNMQAQNAFLKELEEPSSNAYFLMTMRGLSGILPTIKSRASLFIMTGYMKEELRQFTEDETLLSMCATPGQIKRYLEMDWMSLQSHCEKVINGIGRVNLGNIFNIIKHVEEKDYDLIIPMLQNILQKEMISGEKVMRHLRIIQETSSNLENVTGINVRNAMETMFIRLWEVS